MLWAADSIKNKLEKDTLYEEMLLGRGLTNVGNPTGHQKTKERKRKGRQNKTKQGSEKTPPPKFVGYIYLSIKSR